MHIQTCTLIYNLARRRENAKRVAWNEFQKHCTLSSLPPLLPLCTADALRGPGGFCKHTVIPATFPQEENTSGLEISPEGRAQHCLVCKKAGGSEQGAMQLCSGQHWCTITAPHWAWSKRSQGMAQAAGRAGTDHGLSQTLWTSVQSLKLLQSSKGTKNVEASKSRVSSK